MVVRSQSSAAGILALLSEPEAVFKQHALNALNPLVPRFWAEISEHIALMCVLQPSSTCQALISTSVRPCMRVTSCLKRPEMWQHYSRVRYTTTLESTMNLYHSLLVPVLLLKRKHAHTDRQNTLKLLFVRLSSSHAMMISVKVFCSQSH